MAMSLKPFIVFFAMKPQHTHNAHNMQNAGKQAGAGAMNGWPKRYGPRHWAGVPGVRYPEDLAAAAAQQPKESAAPAGWLTTAQAAGLLQVSAVRARSLLRGAGAGRKTVGGKGYWEPEGVRRTAAALPPAVQEPPPGWCTAEEACRLLGCGSSTLARLRDNLPLATLRVRRNGKACRYYNRKQALGVAQAKRAAAKCLLAPGGPGLVCGACRQAPGLPLSDEPLLPPPPFPAPQEEQERPKP